MLFLFIYYIIYYLLTINVDTRLEHFVCEHNDDVKQQQHDAARQHIFLLRL